MKTKKLALANGIVGIAGGVILILGMWLTFTIGNAFFDFTTFTTGWFLWPDGVLDILKVAILVLGIIALVYYKGDARVGDVPSILLIIGGAIALIPFSNWISGIISIVGGSLYLAKLKNFQK